MAKNENISIVNISAIDESCRLSASYLVIESLPAYYKVDGVDELEMATAVAELIGKPGSEIEKGFAALNGDECVGILAFHRSESLPTVRLVGAQALFKHLSQASAKQFRNHLKHYDAGFGAVTDASIYLSRFAIDERYRGSGLACQMMEIFLSMDHGIGVRLDKFSLHVGRENERAIAFYCKYGFSIHHKDSSYLTMVRSTSEA